MSSNNFPGPQPNFQLPIRLEPEEMSERLQNLGSRIESNTPFKLQSKPDKARNFLSRRQRNSRH